MINKPDLIESLSREGIKLRRKGRFWWACCPLHQERTPSFCVDVDRQRWRCFGACNEGGDVIAFIQKRHRLSFKDALRYIGVNGDTRPTRPDPLDIKKREAVRKFRRWEQLYRRAICELLRLANRIDLQVTSPEYFDLPGVSEMYLRKFIYEYHLSILNGKDAGLKFCLYKGLCYGTN